MHILDYFRQIFYRWFIISYFLILNQKTKLSNFKITNLVDSLETIHCKF